MVARRAAVDRLALRSGRFGTRGAADADELLIAALQPLRILQIGTQQPLLDSGRRAVASTNASSLEHGSYLLDRHEFDAIVLGSDTADGWATVAYERLAEVAVSTPVLVQAGRWRSSSSGTNALRT